MKTLAMIPLVLFVLLAGSCTAPTSERETDEVRVSLDEAPPEVKATLVREAQCAKLDHIDRERVNGTELFEADVVIDGKNFEIRVKPDGSLISKKLDKE